MSVSGFDTKFYFYGFLSKTTNQREQELELLSKINSSIVLFLPARDLKKILKEFPPYFEDRSIFIGREITKLHETYLFGSVSELINNISTNDLRGEITLVISSKGENSKNISNIDLIKEIKLLLNKMSSKDISEYLAKKLKISKKIIYQSILKINK